MPFFVGNGGYADILHARGASGPRHFLIPAELEKSLKLEDLSYLKLKGCFSLPTEHDELLRAYFRYVHPVFPIIDALTFTNEYNQEGIDGMNLMLVWAMLSVAASYTLEFRSAEVKQSFVCRAKLLFDLTHESDKAVLVQTALLLSFWFSTAEDSKQSWYWTSIAFSTAQAAGFDQNMTDAPEQIGQRQIILWKSLWTCCLYRDVWLSFSMGRPLRLSASDWTSGTGSATSQLFHGISAGGDDMFSIQESDDLFENWRDLELTTKFLRMVLEHSEDIQTLRRELEAVLRRSFPIDESFELKIARRHLRLHVHAALIHHYRTMFDQTRLNMILDDNFELVEQLSTEVARCYTAPSIIPLLVPAMLVYLHKPFLTTQKIPSQSHNPLVTYLKALEGLEYSYPAASIIRRLFLTAVDSTDHPGLAAFSNPSFLPETRY